MKNIFRLFKDCFSKESFTGKAEKDEMVLYERNKISYVGMTVLTGLLFIFGVFADSLDLRGVSQFAIKYARKFSAQNMRICGRNEYFFSNKTPVLWEKILLNRYFEY